MLALFLTKKNPVGAVSIRRNVTSKMSSSLSYRALDTVESTQDTARMLLHQNSVKTPFLAISAKQQSQGRGTSGRIWKGITGNVFLTVAFSMDRVPVSVTLLPLQVGILIATTLQQVLTKICHESTATIRLKWPNDVLVNQKKVAGVLIESELVNDTTYLLVGIGINIQQAPQIPSNEGRQAACLQEFCSEKLPEQTAEIVAADLANHLVEWMEADGRKDVIQEWKKWADFGTPQTLRDTGERVVPLSIQEDGQLRVRLENGQERLLMAEYLY
jgi:BirA family biotin operon repressor/biotin-[acetyl-CoA-carboxylase] ligase